MSRPAQYVFMKDGMVRVHQTGKLPIVCEYDIIEIVPTEFTVTHPNSVCLGRIVEWKYPLDSQVRFAVLLRADRTAMKGMAISRSKYAAIDDNRRPIGVHILTEWYDLKDFSPSLLN